MSITLWTGNGAIYEDGREFIKLIPRTPIGSPYIAEKIDIMRQVEEIEFRKRRYREQAELANLICPRPENPLRS